MPRPDVAPRPSCRYYASPRGCFAGPRCHFLHDNPTHAPYEANKTCRFFAQGFCKRGSGCWFAHVGPSDGRANKVEAETEGCGICFEERPALYGLLSGCSHAFCLKCIRQWRDSEGKSVDVQIAATHKKCPMCRQMTQFISPSSIYYAQNDPRKTAIIQKYKESMARVSCRHFARSKPEKRFCPFGRDCFYQHTNADGTPYVFADGIEVMMPQWRGRRNETDTAEPEDSQSDPLIVAIQVFERYSRTFADQTGNEGEGGMLRSLTRRAVVGLQNVMMRLMTSSEGEGGNSGAGTGVDAEAEAEAGGREEAQDVEQGGTPTPAAPPRPGATEEPESRDPRSPGNASRPTELVSGDFAWMMAGGEDENATATTNIDM